MAQRLNSTLEAVTDRIRRRSEASRSAYLDQMRAAGRDGRHRAVLSCGNLAHGFAACPGGDKQALKAGDSVNVGIVTAYNDMLSAHQPFERFPGIIKAALNEVGAVGQVAGGVPAMCDGVTQGQPGMELSLFSRDAIAMATAIALSHNMFDAVLCLGVCDKIVPGLLIGALRFGHLPVIFVPAGPMRSGLPNPEKARVRQLYAEGKVGRDALLDAESKSYHSPGTCTFYGTANSNQMLMEIMGLHVPGAAFINPDDPLRDVMTAEAARRAVAIVPGGDEPAPLADIVDARAIANAIVGLHATGGSTNHTIHLIAIARAAGLLVDWSDFHDLAGVTPLLCRVYPNGPADVNHFHAAGGLGFVIRELLDAGLLHEDVLTVSGRGLRHYASEPFESEAGVTWRPAVAQSANTDVVRPVAEPFSADGGLKVLDGDLGRAVIKISAVKPEHHLVEAPAIVFESQDDFIARFKAGELDRDFVAVLRFQGPRANGMPELHRLTPSLGALQDRGFHVALVTDGRMSGASGKVPAAIHVSPEAALGGAIARVRDGDIVRVDAAGGRLTVSADGFAARSLALAPATVQAGMGRELFTGFRQLCGPAEEGALSIPGLAEAAAGPTAETV
ncbi:phosphogluconate dehydratase [Maricaulis virginensis]|uniref:Phosphogluconate dehydratase n=1 Tax=Maricaulis virginensis TaxID=144022 RepID=A0A9W6IK87_9PROT|nr:phosphogluconate dehydratase [Maricaulis virginensis]GLK51856.1 phosphogluconate dehydratase [Maricaulis virginensis]